MNLYKKILYKIKQVLGIDTVKVIDSGGQVVGYDTSKVEIPKYNKLSDEEKKQVDSYIDEIDLDDFEKILRYGNNLYRYSTGVTELLLDLFYRMTDEEKPKTMSKDETLKTEINSLIHIQELVLYYEYLQKLHQESILRTISLEEKYHRTKNDFKNINIFSRDGREKRRNNREHLIDAIERMKINKITIEQLMQAAYNAGKNSVATLHYSERYIKLLNETSEEERRKFIEEKKAQLLEAAGYVIPEEVNVKGVNTDEESQLRFMANLQMKLDLYAYMHKDEIKELEQQVLNIKGMEKTPSNKERLLWQLKKIQIKYKIFGRYISKEQWEDFYNLKLDILMLDINQKENFPFTEIKDKQELEYYKEQISSKIENIITGRNPNLIKIFDKDKIAEVVKILRGILKDGKKHFNIEKILQNRDLLALIYAFDKEMGLEQMTVPRSHIRDIDLQDGLFAPFKWEKMIPIKSIFQLKLQQEEYDELTGSENAYVKIYCKCKNAKTQCEEKEHQKYQMKRVLVVPEGVREIRESRKWEPYHKIILPSTLKRIGYRAFFGDDYLSEVEFNEGLEVIEKEAFLGCYSLGKFNNLKCPSTLKRIGVRAFYNCYNMTPIILNEGLVKIDREAFYCDELWRNKGCGRPHKIIILPSSIRDVGRNIVNTKLIKDLGFKNPRNMQVPIDLWLTFFKFNGRGGEYTFLDNIYLFDGDKIFGPYKRIDPKVLLNKQYKSLVLKQLIEQENER